MGTDVAKSQCVRPIQSASFAYWSLMFFLYFNCVLAQFISPNYTFQLVCACAKLNKKTNGYNVAYKYNYVLTMCAVCPKVFDTATVNLFFLLTSFFPSFFLVCVCRRSTCLWGRRSKTRPSSPPRTPSPPWRSCATTSSTKNPPWTYAASTSGASWSPSASGALSSSPPSPLCLSLSFSIK